MKDLLLAASDAVTSVAAIPDLRQVSRIRAGRLIDQPERKFVMKTSNVTKTFTIAAFIALVLGIAPTAMAADKGCSTHSLLGTFSRRDTGTILLPAAIAGPVAAVGTFTFDGTGNVTGTLVLSQSGNIGRGTQAGTYTVNPDCTGTITVLGASGHASHYTFAMDDDANGFEYICTDSGPISIVYSGTARRQFPVTDWRNGLFD